MTNNIPRDPSNDVHRLIIGKGINDAETFLSRPIVYMVDPSSFDSRPSVRLKVNGYVENAMTAATKDGDFDYSEMCDQHWGLQERVTDVGASIILGPAHDGLLDEVFARDAAISLMQTHKDERSGKITSVSFKTLCSNFYHKARNPEVTNYQSAMVFLKNMLNERFNIGASLQFLTPTDCHGEGGDFMYIPSKDIAIYGHRKYSREFNPKGGRTDKKFHEYAKTLFGLQDKILPVQVANGKFHADVGGHIIGYDNLVLDKNGFARTSHKKLSQLTDRDKIHILSKMAAAAYAANALTLDYETSIMPSEVPHQTIREIERKFKTEVTTTPLSQFTTAGGGPNCLTGIMNLQRNYQDTTVDEILALHR